MSAVHAAFSSRYQCRAGAKNVSVLAECYDSVRSDILVDLPVNQDRHRGSFHASVGLYEKVWIDPVYAIREIYDIDYSSALASCLAQRFDVEQSYMGGSETWHGSFQAEFANGVAVCLWQSFEVVQDYLGGTEAWASSYGQEFALGRAVCLNQIYQIDQPYVGGNELWPSLYGSFFSSGSSNALVQRFDVVQPYRGGLEDWTFQFDSRSPSVTGQSFLVGTENTEIAGLGVAVGYVYEIKTTQTDGTAFAFDSVHEDRYFEAVFSHDHRFYYHGLAHAETDAVLIDTLGGGPRTVDVLSTFAVPETSSLELIGRYDFTEYASACTYCAFDRRNAGNILVQLQEEAYYEYVACLTNVHTSLVTIAKTANLEESVNSLAEHCSGDAEWQMELETLVRFYSPDRPDQSRDPVLWRFLTAGGKHWKQGPVVSDLRAIRLPSFLELHFVADWPYRALERQIDACQFRSTEEGDWFDLAVWISDSLRFDPNEDPVLTIPYASDTTNYDVHVPHRETTRYIAVAPVRKFPYEEIGTLSVIDIP